MGAQALTQRVREFLHVPMQVVVQTVQFLDVPTGHSLKQSVNVKNRVVSALLWLLALNPSKNKRCYILPGLQQISVVRSILITIPSLEDTQTHNANKTLTEAQVG